MEGGAHERGQRGGLDEADQALQARGQLLAVGRRAGSRLDGRPPRGPRGGDLLQAQAPGGGERPDDVAVQGRQEGAGIEDRKSVV